eukprot:scaffold24328_cov24-Prasinocladus_malaysianus.AAC.2
MIVSPGTRISMSATFKNSRERQQPPRPFRLIHTYLDVDFLCPEPCHHTFWRERRRRKQILRQSQEELRHRVASNSRAEAHDSLLQNAKLRHREHEALRKDLKYSRDDFKEVETGEEQHA